MQKIGGFLLVAGLLAGCDDPGFKGVPDVREATAGEVGMCRYVSDISDRPGVYGPLLSEGIKYAHNSIKAMAKDSGANTVVFEQVTPGADIYMLHARAYAC